MKKAKGYCNFLIILFFLLFGLGAMINIRPIHAASKTYYSKKYYKNKKITTSTKTTVSYGQFCYYAKYKERTIIKKVEKVVTVYYKHKKTVSTTNTSKKTKDKINYSKRQTKITDVKKVIPTSVYKKWGKSGYNIIQNPTDDGFPNDYITGIFSEKRKSIILREYRSDQEPLLHEIGHFVDCYSKYKSDSKDFKEIYKQESKKMPVGSYGRTDAGEYFAECFKMYCKSSNTLKKTYPKSYQFLCKSIQNL